jgi:hypothetical protein
MFDVTAIITVKQLKMAKLDSILQDSCASGSDTKDRVLGASFVVVNEKCE